VSPENLDPEGGLIDKVEVIYETFVSSVRMCKSFVN
jgi:hypothetical protein